MNDASPVIAWEEPPSASRKSKYDHAAIATELENNPGQWAKVFDGAPAGITSMINTGKLSAYKPAGSFEAVSRRNGNGDGAVIYARYVGQYSGSVVS